ncbi:transposase [Myxococcus xanthus]|nr:transposase [Myxococcus xanthus]
MNDALLADEHAVGLVEPGARSSPECRRLWRRFTVHFTPVHGSWLNQAEVELSLLSRQCLGRRRIPTLDKLDQETGAWERWANRQRLRIRWRFTVPKARAKFGYNSPIFSRSEE